VERELRGADPSLTDEEAQVLRFLERRLAKTQRAA